jgi:hypothetical protein
MIWKMVSKPLGVSGFSLAVTTPNRKFEPTRLARPGRRHRRTDDYCTLAVTDAFAFSVNVHVFVLFPALEHAPDQIASRPSLTVNVIDVPALNGADPLEPTETLMPAGFDVTRSPLRPVAETVNVAVPPAAAGFTVSVPVRVTPPCVPEIVTAVEAVTVFDVTVNVPLVAPAAIVRPAVTVAALVLLLESVTTAPPDGAAAVSVAVPVAFALPPVTLAGEIETDESVGPAGGVDVCTVKLRVGDHEPTVPALFRPRTRHQYWRAVRAVVVSCDTVVVVLIVNGDPNELDVST